MKSSNELIEAMASDCSWPKPVTQGVRCRMTATKAVVRFSTVGLVFLAGCVEQTMQWNKAKPWLSAVGVAVAYDAAVVTVWAILPRYNPITNWLLDRFAGTDPTLYRGLVWTHGEHMIG